MEKKLNERFKESFIEMLTVWIILILIAGCLLLLSLLAYFNETDSGHATDERIFWTLGFSILFLAVSVLGLVVMLLRYGHDRKVLANKKYEIYEGELAYMDICISGDEEGTKTYIPVMKDLKTGKKIRLDHGDPIVKDQTYLIYCLPKTKISVAERKFEEQ